MVKNLILFLLLLPCAFGLLQAQTDTESTNNSINTPDVISFPGSNSATMSNSNDVDYFKISTGNNTGVLLFRVTNVGSNMKTRLQIFNENQVSLGYRDALSNGANDTLELVMDYGGNYYIKITNINSTSSSSNYTLEISRDGFDTYEFNNTIDAVSPTSVNTISVSTDESNPTQIQGKIRGYYRTSPNGYPYYGDQFGNLSADVDIYKITTGTQMGVLVMTIPSPPSNLKMQIQVINADGTTSEGYRYASTNGDTLRFEYLTEYAGIYYIKVSNVNGNANGSGNTNAGMYTLNISLDTLGMEFNDDIASVSPNSIPSIAISTDESNPTQIQGKIRGYYRTSPNGYPYYGDQFGNLSADVDIYKITTGSQMGVLVMTIPSPPSNLKMRIQVINADGTTSEGYRVASVNGDTLRFEYLTQYAGIHYIKVSNVNNNANGSGNTSAGFYTLNISLDTMGMEFNDAIDAVSPTSVNTISVSTDESNPTQIQGKIRGYYRTSPNGYPYYGDQFGNLSADVDIYKITTGTQMGVLVMTIPSPPSNLKMQIQVINADGTMGEGYRDASVNGDTLRFEYLTKYAGIYYIKVSNVNGNTNGSGNTNAGFYTLNISLDTTGLEFNDNISAVSPTTVPSISVSTNESNPTQIQGKIRGYYRSDYNNYYGDQFANMAVDNDYYKITTGTKMGVLVMTIPASNSNLKLGIQVFNQNGSTSEGYRVAATNGDSLRFEYLTQYAGVYYIRVWNTNGLSNGNGNTSPVPYTLNISLDTTDMEFNNTINNVSPSTVPVITVSNNLSSPTQILGKIRGYYRDSNNYYGDQFANMLADNDYYKITTGTKNGVLVMTIPAPNSNLKLGIQVFNQNGSTSEGFRVANTNGDSLRFELLTKYAGVYYIRVWNNNNLSNGNGNTSAFSYTLNISLDTTGTENDNTVNDVSPSTVPALTISNNESSPTQVIGNLRGYYRSDYNSSNGDNFANLSADNDYYKINTGTKMGVLVMTIPVFASNLRMGIQVINADGSTSEGYRVASTNGDSLRFEYLTKYAGIHFIRVYNNNGNANGNGNTSPALYTLNITLDTTGYEYNNSVSLLMPTSVSAIAVSTNENNPTQLQGKMRGMYRTNYNNNGDQYSSLTPDTIDIYKITTNGKKGVLSMLLSNVTLDLRLKLQVINADGSTSEGYRIASVAGDTVRLELLTQYAGVYYVRVSNVVNTISPVPYLLTMSLDTSGMEFNNTISSVSSNAATPISFDENQPTTISGKMRGLYRTNYTSNSGDQYANLSPDTVDIYKVTTQNSMGVMVIRVLDVPSNEKLKIQVIKDNGTTSEGYIVAATTGDTVRLDLLTQYAGTYYIRISNTVNAMNPLPYTLKVSLDTLEKEFNNTISTAANVATNTNISGKIKGYYRTDYTATTGDAYANLARDKDYYKPDTCGTFLFAKVTNVSSDLKLKLSAFDINSSLLGTITATNAGDTVLLSASALSNPSAVKYILVQNSLTGTSNIPYTLFLGYNSPQIGSAGSDVAICSGTNATLNGTLPANTTGIWTKISGTGIILSPSSATTQVKSITGTVNAFEWKVTQGNCSSRDTAYISKPGVPQNVQIDSVGITSVTFSWTSPSNPDSFHIRLHENCITSNQLNFRVPGNVRSFTLTNLKGCTNYCIRVRSQCGTNVYTSWSNMSAPFTTSGPVSCAAITNLVISPVQGCLYNLDWSTGCTSADSFRVRYRVNNGTWVISNGTTGTNQNLTLGQGNWEFRVQTWCGGVNVATSATYTYTIGNCTIPYLVTATQNTACSYKIQWETCAPSDSFRVRYREGANAFVSSPYTTANFVNLNLGAGNWEFRVQSWCGNVLNGTTNVQALSIPSCRMAGSSPIETYTTPVTLYPNPTSTTSLLQFTSAQDAPYLINVTDVSGRVFQQIQGQATAGENTVEIPTEGLSKGIYFIGFKLQDHSQVLKWTVQ